MLDMMDSYLSARDTYFDAECLDSDQPGGLPNELREVKLLNPFMGCVCHSVHLCHNDCLEGLPG